MSDWQVYLSSSGNLTGITWPLGVTQPLKGARFIDHIHHIEAVTARKDLYENVPPTPNSDIFYDTIKPQEPFINVIIIVF